MTDILTPAQCRAARALLDIKQAELADEAGLSAGVVIALEKGTTQTKPDTLRRLRDALERAGIEFGGDDGVKRRTGTIEVWEGKDANRRMLEDIYADLKETGGEILIAGLKEVSADRADDVAFLEWHLDRLKKAGITERILVVEGDTNLVAPAHWYRQLPRDYFSQATFQLYGNKLAMIAWGDEQRVTIIDNKLHARGFAKLFNFAWDNAEPVTGAS
ncbi:MAG: helix-turn-helix transcriptional regulator [Devosia sp.]